MSIDIMFLSAVCDNQAYTYIRRLNTCIKRNAAKVTFDDARADCQADGGDLLMVKTNDVRLYLKDIMLAVTGCMAFHCLGPPRSVLWQSLCRKSIFVTSHTVKCLFLLFIAFVLDLNFSVRQNSKTKYILIC